MSRRNDDEEPHIEPDRPPAYPMEEALESAFSPPPPAIARWNEDPQPALRQPDEPNGDEPADQPTNEQPSEATNEERLDIGARADATKLAPISARDPERPPESVEQRLAGLPRWQARYVLALMQYGGVMGLACGVCSVSRESVMKAQAASVAFAAACAEAVEHSTDILEAASFKRATIGDLQPIYQGQLLVGYKRVASPKDAEIMLKVRGRLKDQQDITVTTTSKVEVVHRAEIGNRVRAVIGGLLDGVVEGEVVEQEPKSTGSGS